MPTDIVWVGIDELEVDVGVLLEEWPDVRPSKAAINTTRAKEDISKSLLETESNLKIHIFGAKFI